MFLKRMMDFDRFEYQYELAFDQFGIRLIGAFMIFHDLSCAFPIFPVVVSSLWFPVTPRPETIEISWFFDSSEIVLL